MLSGAAILAVFLLFAALMFARVVPALLALPAMAVCMALVAGVPWNGAGTIVVAGAASLASVYVTVIFGAMLGRVTLDTGIARSIVNFAAEFGGDRPPVVALILSAAVAALFVSLSGLGAIIMVGSIVLPVMMTTGVPRKIAATMFLMAFALGFIFNIVNWKFYTQFFGVTPQQMLPYALLLAAIDLVALIAYAATSFRAVRGYAAWAAAAPPGGEEGRAVPWWSLATPILPIALYFGFHLDPTLAFILAALYGALATKPRRVVQTLAAAAIRGVEDVAPAIVLFMGIGMLLVATKTPQFAAALRPLAEAGVLRNPFAFVALFGLASPLVLYRGPLNPFGVGIAVFTALLVGHVFPPVVLVAAIMAVVQVQNVCDPTNTSNVWVANFTGVPIAEITRRTLPYQVAVATAACIAVVAASSALFGVRPFVAMLPEAAAAEPAATPAPAFPGLFAPPGAAYHVAVGSDGSALATLAAATVVRSLNGWRRGLRAFPSGADPNAADCSAKNYAAFVTATATTFKLIEGTDLDIGVRLSDCGGWEVDEWHDHEVFRNGPQPAGVKRLALQGLARMRRWSVAHPRHAHNLFAHGVAWAPGDKPTYFFALFKTVDGNMRCFVRAGGPAYDAGMRTNDVVEKLDGKYWWDYGTYQTELRAYDGKPHSFELQRGSQTIEVRLGAPYTGGNRDEDRRADRRLLQRARERVPRRVEGVDRDTVDQRGSRVSRAGTALLRASRRSDAGGRPRVGVARDRRQPARLRPVARRAGKADDAGLRALRRAARRSARALEEPAF